MVFFKNRGGTSFLPLVATLYLSNKSHVSAVVWGSGDATMELGVNVACVTHASLVGAMLCGYQILTTRGTLSRTILREVRNEGMLQWVTIEEHQVGDLVFTLLQLFIHVFEGHIDLVIIQYDVAQYNN
jgi:hypothetical protein